MAKYRTKSQVQGNRGTVRVGGAGTDRLTANRRSTDRIFDRMLRHPTIRLAVDVITAMMMQQQWSMDGPDEKVNEYMLDQLNAHRKKLIRSSLLGMLVSGWRVFETSYGFAQNANLGLRQTIEGVKALKSTRTEPLVDSETGELVGFENTDRFGHTTLVDRDHMILVNPDEEGFGELSDPQFRVSEGPFSKWEKCDEGAARYDEKVAGGFLWIKYPVGTTPFSENGNAETDNSKIAAALGASYKAAGWGATPVRVEEDGDGTQTLLEAWKAEIVSAAGGLQPGFITRLKYLDALMLRAFGIPERSVTEGTFGTKAEAEAHADIAILVNTSRHDVIVDSVNEYAVRPLNRANWGDPKATTLVLGKLDPTSRELFSQIFTALMADPMLGHDVSQRVSIEQLLEKLSIPTKPIEQIQKEAFNNQALFA